MIRREIPVGSAPRGTPTRHAARNSPVAGCTSRTSSQTESPSSGVIVPVSSISTPGEVPTSGAPGGRVRPRRSRSAASAKRRRSTNCTSARRSSPALTSSWTTRAGEPALVPSCQRSSPVEMLPTAMRGASASGAIRGRKRVAHSAPEAVVAMGGAGGPPEAQAANAGNRTSARTDERRIESIRGKGRCRLPNLPGAHGSDQQRQEGENRAGPNDTIRGSGTPSSDCTTSSAVIGVSRMPLR